MDHVNQAAWEAAALRLLDDVYAFAATGPRTHADWRDDVLAVMNREVSDPRGWTTLDWDRDKEERAANSPSFPFVPLSREALGEKLFVVAPDAAVQLLVTMTYEWGPVPSAQAPETLADALTVLGRYGEQASCYSNITQARNGPSPDLSAGVTAWAPLTPYDGDFGVVAVSPDEVGVFWSFDPS